MPDLPAILGHAPAFPQPVRFVKPDLPRYSAMDADLREIVASGMLTKGVWLRRFEEAVAEHLGVRHAVAVSSCTTGLMLTYRGLDLTGDVVVPSFTFMATVGALVWAGLRPVFADVDRGSTNLTAEQAERAITPNTSAIVGVHNFGNPAEIEALEAVADRHGLKLVFDSAHGFGARYRGAPVGRQGDAHVFSLSPTKLLIAAEGGIVSTNDDELAQRIRVGREYGNDGRYDSLFAGINARMPEMNALLGLRSLEMLEDTARRRNEAADEYCRGLRDVPGLEPVAVAPGNRCSYKDFSITVDAKAFGLSRDELVRGLAAENIDTRNYYDPPVHRHKAYRHFAPANLELPNTEFLAASSVSLPIGSNLGEGTVRRICEAVARLHRAASAVRAALRGRARRWRFDFGRPPGGGHTKGVGSRFRQPAFARAIRVGDTDSRPRLRLALLHASIDHPPVVCHAHRTWWHAALRADFAVAAARARVRCRRQQPDLCHGREGRGRVGSGRRAARWAACACFAPMPTRRCTAASRGGWSRC